MAFVLLDEAPGKVLPVGRGPSPPPLLEALGRLAAPPAYRPPARSYGPSARHQVGRHRVRGLPGRDEHRVPHR